MKLHSINFGNLQKHTAWLKRKKGSLCILAGICAAALFVIINSGEKINENNGDAYAVRIRHYGVNAAEMERSITIPLGDALYSIPGVMKIQSSSENSLSSVYVMFKPDAPLKRSSKGRYEAVRDAVQSVYETLASSVQRPEIISSSNSRIPVWSAAVFDKSKDISYNDQRENEDALIANLLEKTVKPRLESLEGSAEALVAGTGVKEIYITLDQEKLEILKLEPASIISYLAMNDSIFSGGSFIQSDKEIIMTIDSRYDRLESSLIPVGEGRFIELSEVANVSEQEREPEILSRLNGRRTASIAVMGRHGADLRKLSSEIKKELENLSLPVELIVLSDLGAEEAAAFRSALNAALSGAFMVALISFILNRKDNSYIPALLCALTIPVICLISAAVLSIVGLSLDRLLLAGIAAGIGTAIDAVILCSEKLRKCPDYNSAVNSLAELKGPLIAGGATTAAALIPLSAIGQSSFQFDTSVGIIANSIAVVTIISLVISLTLLPPLLLWRINKKTKESDEKKKNTALSFLSRKLCRFLARIINFCAGYPSIVLLTGIVITITAGFLLFVKGVDTSVYGSEDSVYGQVEFNGGLLAEEVDRLLTVYSDQLSEIKGIKNIETGARTGTGSILISFDPKKTKSHLVKEAAKEIYIPGGFVFFHENSSNDRYWEIIVYGDEDQKCRQIAKEMAIITAGHPIIRECVLNFKEGNKKISLIPDREILSKSNISFSSAASRVHLGVFGPVGYKRMEQDDEIDVRFKIAKNENSFTALNASAITSSISASRQTREGILNLLVPSENIKQAEGISPESSSLYINTLMLAEDEIEPSSIRRDNRRRSASITISTRPMDPRRVKQELEKIFNMIELPQGYSIEFDPDAIKQSEDLTATILSLIMAIIFCYMIIASVNESFTIPLIVLSAVPPSLAIPALCLALSGVSYNSAVACAFIAVSGMTVNAAILCVDSCKLRLQKIKTKNKLNIYCALRKKMPALLATTGTTIAGAVPFLFLTENANTLIRTLSLVGALGVTGSFLCSITIIPSLLSININYIKFKNKNTSIKNYNVTNNILLEQDTKSFGVKNDKKFPQ